MKQQQVIWPAGTRRGNRYTADTSWQITSSSNGSIAPLQHMPKRSLGLCMSPLTALSSRAQLQEKDLFQ